MLSMSLVATSKHVLRIQMQMKAFRYGTCDVMNKQLWMVNKG
jgi:hypothetical protein